MSTHALTDRYVYATIRAVPEAQREDLARELRAEIDEMVAARTEAGEALADAERATLLGLGDPERLAASYADRPLQLIGPTYFLVWKRLLTTLLLWVPATLALVLVVLGLLDSGDDVAEVIGEGIGTGFQVALHIAFWTTLVFALMDRYGTPSDAPEWSLADLPEIPAQRAVGLGETVGAVATNVVVLALLVWQEARGVIEPAESDTGARIPLIDSDLWSSWLPVVVAGIVLEIVIVLLAYRRGRWSWPLVGAATVADLLAVVPVAVLLVGDRFFDPHFAEGIGISADSLHDASVVIALLLVVTVLGELVGRVRAAAGRGEARARPSLPDALDRMRG